MTWAALCSFPCFLKQKQADMKLHCPAPFLMKIYHPQFLHVQFDTNDLYDNEAWASVEKLLVREGTQNVIPDHGTLALQPAKLHPFFSGKARLPPFKGWGHPLSPLCPLPAFKRWGPPLFHCVHWKVSASGSSQKPKWRVTY